MGTPRAARARALPHPRAGGRGPVQPHGELHLHDPASGLGDPGALADALQVLAGGSVRLWRVEADRVRPLGREEGAWWPDAELRGDRGRAVRLPDGSEAWLEPVPGAAGTWLQLGPDDADAATRPARARAAALVAGRTLAAEREAHQAARELMLRYEEINLLYSISEILGRTIDLDEATRTIVKEVAMVVGAGRASIMLHDPAARALRVVAAYGVDRAGLDPVPVADPTSVAARVFRELRTLGADDPETGVRPPDRGYRGRAFLSVPIVYAGHAGSARPIGVVNLTERLGEDAFPAGTRKLLTAVATQIGAAIENVRLAGAARERERLGAELAAAHQLQVALLPTPELLARAGDVGVRFQSADSVSGDFYKVIPRATSVGVLIGDVSSHGLIAALLMTHVLSAAGILAQASDSPEQALRKLLELIGEDLRRAEMSMSCFFGVINPRRRSLRYANAGHPQAFLVPADGGAAHRLGATAPPLGLADADRIDGAEVPWRSGKDLLCLFTDGLSEARNAAGEPFGERRVVETVVRERALPAARIVARVFERLTDFTATVADDRTLLLVRR